MHDLPEEMPLPLPGEFPKIEDMEPADFAGGYCRSVDFHQRLIDGSLKVPPCNIGGEDTDLVSREADGGLTFDGPDFAKRICAVIQRGLTEFKIDIPGIAAQAIGDIVMDGRTYFIEEFWQQALVERLPLTVQEACGKTIKCVMTVRKPTGAMFPSIHAEVRVLVGGGTQTLG